MFISLFREITLQPMGEHKIKIECNLTTLGPFKASILGVTPQNGKMAPGAANIEYLNNR